MLFPIFREFIFINAWSENERHMSMRENRKQRIAQRPNSENIWYNIKQVLDAFVPSVNSNKFPSKRGKSDGKLLFNWLQSWHVWQSTIWICWRACNSVQKAWASLSFVSPWVKKRCWTVLSEHRKYLVLLLLEVVSLLAVQVFL